jgi:hypothetical protein
MLLTMCLYGWQTRAVHSTGNVAAKPYVVLIGHHTICSDERAQRNQKKAAPSYGKLEAGFSEKETGH